MYNLQQKIWWEYLKPDLKKLFNTSVFLISEVESWSPDLPGAREVFDDYAFVVFPAAKAYEGFLKNMFLDLGFISREDYLGKHFRIGKSLNPNLSQSARNDEVYEKIVKYCGGKSLADTLWETWRVCRNLTFHWFPDENNTITFPEAKERVELIIKAIDMAFFDCKLNK